MIFVNQDGLRYMLICVLDDRLIAVASLRCLAQHGPLFPQGKLCWVLQCLFTFLGFGKALKRLVNAPTLEEQKRLWNSNFIVHFIKHGPALLVWIFCKFVKVVFCNRVVLWFGGGVPGKQYALIKKDGVPIEQYIARTLDGVAECSHLRKANYFYYNCLTGKFLRDNCPSYLREEGFNKLKAGVIDRLTVATGTFLDELKARKYTKVGAYERCGPAGLAWLVFCRLCSGIHVQSETQAELSLPFPFSSLQVILMDHVDWLDIDHATVVAQTLAEQVLPGGIVIWRSAAMTPPYAELIRQAGFDVRCIQRADQGYMDRWVAEGQDRGGVGEANAAELGYDSRGVVGREGMNPHNG